MNKAAKKFLTWILVIIALFIIFLFMGPFYIIDEGNQVVVTRFGSIVNTHTDAGLHIKVPFLDKITTYPKLVLSLDGDAQRIPTKENQFIIVDTTSRWRISNPEKFYQSFTSLNNAYNKLSDIIDSSCRTVITQNRLSEIVRSSNIINESVDSESSETNTEDTQELNDLLTESNANETVTKGRSELCRLMTVEANKLVPEYGIDLIDIVPRQIKYSDELTESDYNRMIKDRNQVAQAYRKSEEIKGNADAEAAAIYAAAYNKDPEFYAFWKSMESYKNNLKDYPATYSTNMDYFKYMYSPDGKR